jgi:integrase/recombinase XerD
MARKFSEENERIKRQYMQFLRVAKRCDPTTVDKAADAILRFERTTSFKPFKRFHIEQAMAFKRQLEADRNTRTGKPLAKATNDGTLRAVKAFVLWLAGQPGYKSRITYAEYLNLNAKDARIAHAERDTPFPTMEQCRHAFGLMPSATLIDRRNKALFAFLTLTGARDGAIASLRLKRIDLVEGCVYQDARDVKTKFAKTFTTADLPAFAPHSFRKTLVKYGDQCCKTCEQVKAWSQNMGHDSVVTTISAYCPVSRERQAELIKALG